MKPKPKIYATGNQNIKPGSNMSYYIFEKGPSFLDWLAKLLTEVLDIDREEVKFIVKRKDTDKDDWVEDEVYIKDIDKMVDLHESYTSKQGDRVDVFYGKTRAYVTLTKSGEIRQKFADFVKKTKQWIQIKKVKELPVYAGKKVK